MNGINLKRKLYTTKTDTSAVYSAEYDGEKCYAIVNNRTGFTAIFDYDKRVWESLKRFMREKKYSIAYDKDPSGLSRFRLVTAVSGAEDITLRRFLWARYNRRYLSNAKGVVHLRQDNRADNWCDLRRHNIYLAGDSLEGRDDVTVRLISNPKNESEQWIEVTFNLTEPFIEFVNYTPELWEMLNTPRFVRLETMSCDRGMVTVDGYSIPNALAKFVCIYKKYFPLYQGKKDAVQKFIHDYRSFSKLEKDRHAAHVNSYYHENTFDNLMFMDSGTNHAMSDYIKWLADGYDAYTAVNDRDEILLEFIIPFRESPLYIKFETPEDYADFQRVYIFGTKFSKKMQRVTYLTADGLAYQMTPTGMRAAGIVNKDTVKERELDFWTDREHKDNLLSLPDEAFTVYHKEALEKARVIHDVAPEGMKKGDVIFFPIDGGGYGVAELVRTGRQKKPVEDNTPIEMPNRTEADEG